MIKFDKSLFFNIMPVRSDIESVWHMVGSIRGDTIIVDQLIPSSNLWRGDKTRNYTFRKPKIATIGHIHTHLVPCITPSIQDYAFIRVGEIGCVWTLKSGELRWYTNNGVIQKDKLDYTGLTLPAWYITTGTIRANTRTVTSATATTTATTAGKGDNNQANHNANRKNKFLHRLIPPF